MKKICVFTLYDKDGASSFYRSYIFKKDFEEKFDVSWYYFWNNTYVAKYMNNKKKYFLHIAILYLINSLQRILQIVLLASKSDVVIFQKAVIPKFKFNFINYLKKRNIKVIFDVDDAIYLGKNDNSNQIAKLSDTVVVGNEILKRHYQKYSNRIKILPTVDYSPMYEEFYKDTFSNKCIGWIGSQATINNLDLLVNPLNKIMKKYPEIKFKLICNQPHGYEQKIKNTHFVKWHRDTYLSEMSEFTIGVMPLRNNEYNSGKNGFKLIQYLNLKKPVIADNVGVNAKIVSDNGLIVNSEEEWYRALETLLFNKDVYNNHLNNIEKDFFYEYHYSNILNKWLDILANEENY